MGELLTFESLIALLTLASLEIVLGIDNVVFIAILTAKLDPAVQKKAQRVGLLLAMVMRILLLLAISWIMSLQEDLFTLFGAGFSGKDLILLAGGLFLIGKATFEIHHKLEVPDPHDINAKARAISSFGAAIAQIVMIDLVFSLDSVITAVGMAKHIEIMIVAIVAAVGVMMAFAGAVSAFIDRHPTMKMLALSFLLLIGVMLTADGLGHHIERGYVYFAMGFSFVVELLNLRVRAARDHAAAARANAAP
ncbi:MAG: TerC family protein [Phycisphaerales bacterium]|nr:MAG: TerC family protein [Phycisphaerales bacterium]